jgi:hypothetical protein
MGVQQPGFRLTSSFEEVGHSQETIATIRPARFSYLSIQPPPVAVQVLDYPVIVCLLVVAMLLLGARLKWFWLRVLCVLE